MTLQRFALAALAVALLAAATLPGRPAGIGVTILAWALIALVSALSAPRAPAWTVAAAALAAMATLRSAPWVVGLSLVATAALASLGAAGGVSARELATGATGWLRHAVPGPLLIAGALARGAGSRSWERFAPAARGAVLAAVLLAVFVPLFVTADAAFAEIVDSALTWPVESIEARLAMFVLVLVLAGALACTATAPGPRPRRRGDLGRTEWLIALGALDALFAGFVVLQLTALFGGHEHVLRTTGLTYAEYARQGFGQLIAAAALTLGVLALARRDSRALRTLRAVLCALTLVVLASALKRLGLYEDTFGFTRLRILAHAQILWLGALFVLVLAAQLARHAAWLPHATVAVSAVFALGFGIANPDARIAEHNIERYERTGRIDRAYLATLSPDAAAVLPASATGRLRAQLARSDGRAGWNLARSRARAALTP